jgi:hypothetical protein
VQEIIGNLFDPNTYRNATDNSLCNFWPDVIVITTNGFVKKNGAAVMGRGCARAAVNTFANYSLEITLGSRIRTYGNTVHNLGSHLLPRSVYNNNVAWSLGGSSSGIPRSIILFAFPVKAIVETCAPDKQNVVKHMQDKFSPGQTVPGWACKADINIIKNSAHELVNMVDSFNFSTRPRHIVMPRPGCGAGELSWSKIHPILNEILDDGFYSITFPSRR